MSLYAISNVETSTREEIRAFVIAWLDAAKLPLHITVRECGDPDTRFVKAMLSSGEEEEDDV